MLKRIFTAVILLSMCCTLNVWAEITPTTPSKDDNGVYQIGTAEELWGFASIVNGGELSANAKLTEDIDMGGSTNGSFPGIGTSSSTAYKGTFNGNGKTISNYYCSRNTTGTGFFNYTSGGTISNFTLEGTMDVNTTSGIYGVGSIAGLPTNTTFEDITSSVIINLKNIPAGGRIFGGMFGRLVNVTVNRCRFNGTIDATNSTKLGDRIAGIAGDARSGTIKNTLFDGTIIVKATTGTINVGGILGRPEGGPIYIENCLSVGTIDAAVVTNTGMIYGSGNNTSAPVTKAYYDKSKVQNGYTAVGTPIEDTWLNITRSLNNDNNDLNWKIKEGADYPVPAIIIPHTHKYNEGDGNNGICDVDDCEEPLQPATTAKDGYYEIGNAGQLVWFGQHINEGLIPANSNARMTNSITNVVLPEFSGIGTAEHPYAGIFDGHNEAVRNSFTTAKNTGPVGMFAYLAGTSTQKAIIKDLELEGTFNVKAAREGIGALVGNMGDYTLIDNVHSHVTINVTHADAKYIGGLVGIMSNTVEGQTELSMACYNSTINVTASSGPIGGLVGDMRGGKIVNSIFDGEIKTGNTTADLVIGGIAGQSYKESGSYHPSYISKCLSHGKITATGATSTKLGSIMGRTNQTVTTGSNQTTYFVNDGANTDFGNKASDRVYQTFTDASSMTKEYLRSQLGEANWAQGDNYPFPQRGGSHTHKIDADGFCFANDGTYQSVTLKDGYYPITNAGQLYWFAQSVNDGTIATNSNAKLMNDINMYGQEWGVFPMIGNASHKFTGVFDGQGHTISNIVLYSGEANTTQSGMFIAASGADIKNFKVTGTFYIAGNIGNTHGGITGVTNGANYTDVNCAINVQCLTQVATISQVGGFAGLANGGSTINRCRYSGEMLVNSGLATGVQDKTGDTHDAIGGLFGQTNNATITNCLFDGEITANSTNEALNVGGLIGYAETKTTLNNCFSHGTITLPSGTYTKCGAVVGRGTVVTSASNYYTGTAKGAGTVNATIATEEDVKNFEGILYLLGDANWHLDSNQSGHYPVPMAGTHVHRFVNGFCLGEAYDEVKVYEECIKGTDGRYEVDNGGKLWWLAQQINNGTLPKNTRIKLMQDIDMEDDKHGSFPGICPLGSKQVNLDGTTKNVDDWTTAYQGIFDGQGHTINHFYRNITTGIRQGLFNSAENATIKNFNINGNITITSNNNNNNNSVAMCGAVIGMAHNGTLIEGINSSVNFSCSGVRSVGGIAGCLEDATSQATAKMNRCRYNGTITLIGNGSNNNIDNNNIGGLVGEIRSAYLSNCLFDGTIKVNSGILHQSIGGWAGLVNSYNNSEIHRSLSHGSIQIEGFIERSISDNKVIGSLAGACVGTLRRTLYVERCFYTTSRNDANIKVSHAAQIETQKVNDENVESLLQNLLLGSAKDMTADLDELYSESFRSTLGEPNWAAVTSGYTYPLKDSGHIHKYVDGFCTAGDGEYEKPSHMGGIYQIDNGGKLYWFAVQFNEGNIPQNATVEILKDINMRGNLYTYPGIGSQSRPFKGTFNGYGHSITGFMRNIINSANTGLINYSRNATIKSFSITGSINYNLASAQSFHGSIVGYANGDSTLIEDIVSDVDLYIQNTRGRVIGGIAGRASGIINRCHYSGHIAALDLSQHETYTTSGEQIGGFCGNGQQRLTISNCLFDGKIWAKCSNPIMRVSGFLASNEVNSGVKIAIKNCIFNGCLDLVHDYVEPEGVSSEMKDGVYVDKRKKDSGNGIIAGYWDSGIASAINNVYYIKSCDAMSGMTAGNWATTPSVNTSQDVTSNPDWTAIKNTLNTGCAEDSPNWTIPEGKTLPQPKTNICSHRLQDGTSAYNEFGWCTLCNSRKVLELDTDGKYKMTQIADLASFRDLVNSGTVDAQTELNAKLTQDIDFDGFEGELGEPIGNSHHNRYLYNFDGQGHTIKNIRVTTGSQFIGLFGFAGDESHDCYIHDFTITGEFNVPYDSKNYDDKPLYMGVVGKMYRGKIENVHSQIKMTNTNPTRAIIGGILGYAETTDDNHAVIIDKCSYTGICNANAVGNFGGIVGQTSKNTEVKNCTFAGTMNHTYQGQNNNTQFGGIVGKNDEHSFQGVKNCVIAGKLNTDPGRTFVSYTEEGNHKNIMCGFDTQIADGEDHEYNAHYSNNYALEDYLGKFTEISYVNPNYFVTQTQMANGEICAIMNKMDNAPTDVQNGHPWGQIIGYQLSGNRTEGSPAQRVPFPGYQNPDRKVYKVVKDASNNYTIDYLYLDDLGDATPLPSDAASIKAKKIEYTRSGSYMTNGFVSVCMPFALTADMLPGGEDCLVKVFDKVKEENGANYVYFKDYKVSENPEVKFPVAAGTPVFFYLPESARKQPWSVNLSNESGIDIAKAANNPETGILGTFNTALTGEWSESAPMYKIKSDGVTLVKTTASSHCYPYRAYLKLSGSSNASEYRLSFENLENETGVSTVLNESQTAPRYNLMGQRVGRDAKGMIIRNGKICIVK